MYTANALFGSPILSLLKFCVWFFKQGSDNRMTDVAHNRHWA